ncbi:MAG: hypothetical protein Q8P95_02465 [bacterium]|nr:hypothetical protein [bacterium]
MNVTLTWDLIITVFFVVIMAYSFIVGRHGTAKIIISSYIAMLAANGIAQLVSLYVPLQSLVSAWSTTPEQNVVLLKIFLFILLTLVLVMKGAFLVDTGFEQSIIIRFITTSVYGFLSAGLIISTILVFMSGPSGGVLASNISPAFDVSNASLLVRSLVNYYSFWFAAPAVAFIISSLIARVEMPVADES